MAYRVSAVDLPMLIPSRLIAYVAMGAPPIVDGITIDAKSHESATLNEAGQLSALSDKNLIFAAMNKTRNRETTKAIARPGSRFGAIRSSIPGSYVNQMTAAIVSMLMLNDSNTYRRDTGTWVLPAVPLSDFIFKRSPINKRARCTESD
jgi:hypothetical protein